MCEFTKTIRGIPLPTGNRSGFHWGFAGRMGTPFQGISALLVGTCADLVGDDARTPADIATRDGVSRSAVYMRRRRLEKRAKVLLPRQHRVGRPIEPQPGCPIRDS
jgi:hypothetical protein